MTHRCVLWTLSCNQMSLMHAAGIKTRGDVLKMGIGKYNEECRSIVMR